MSGLWRKTLVYLGLVEEPDEHDELPERVVADAAHVPEPVPDPTPQRGDYSNVRPLRSPEAGGAHARVVTTGDGGSAPVAVLTLTVFDDVEEVGARHREGQPVLIDLRQVDKALARRVLDFVSGMTYALQGHLQPAGNRTFLLLPSGVELTQDGRRQLEDLGFRGGG